MQIIIENKELSLIIHCYSKKFHGFEDGLSLLPDPGQLMNMISSLRPDLKPIIFFDNSSEILAIKNNWNFYNEGILRWTFALLIKNNTYLDKKLLYILKGYLQDQKRQNIFLRNGKDIDDNFREKVSEAAKIIELISDTSKNILSDSESSKWQVLIDNWLRNSPVFLYPYFTKHGEGVSVEFNKSHAFLMHDMKMSIKGFAKKNNIQLVHSTTKQPPT